MAVKKFYLMGGDPTSVREVDIGDPADMDNLKEGIAGEYSIINPSGMHPSMHRTRPVWNSRLHSGGFTMPEA